MKRATDLERSLQPSRRSKLLMGFKSLKRRASAILAPDVRDISSWV